MSNLITFSEDRSQFKWPAPTPEMLEQAEAAEQKAARARARRDESWERSDTDGFISQWASGLTDEEHRLQAAILRDGGVSVFLGLFKDGRRVKARLVEGKFGQSWCVLDAAGNAREWLPNSVTGQGTKDDPIRFGPRTKAAKLGYEIGYELAPAKAAIVGHGHGLSGQAWVTTVRLDEGYPEDAVPYEELD